LELTEKGTEEKRRGIVPSPPTLPGREAGGPSGIGLRHISKKNNKKERGTERGRRKERLGGVTPALER